MYTVGGLFYFGRETRKCKYSKTYKFASFEINSISYHIDYEVGYFCSFFDIENGEKGYLF